MTSTLKSEKIYLNNSSCKYNVIPMACNALGWCTTQTEENWSVLWTDSGQHVLSYVRCAKKYQRVNHFPGMINIYRKGNLARSLSIMNQISSAQYNFFPKTWLLPYDYESICNHLNEKNDNFKCVIVKPIAGSQGKGIYLALNSEDLNPEDSNVVQEYIHNPLLIDGFKFDLRIYVLITCAEPLRILIYQEGLVRLCTKLYEVRIIHI